MTERHAVVVVGAGPAGMAAALELKGRGVSDVVILEREEVPGGVPRFCHHPGFGLHHLQRLYSGPTYARACTRRVQDAGIEMRTSAAVTGWAGPLTLAVTSPRVVACISADAVLLATGCRERPRSARLVPGSRPQGIFTTGSLQRFADNGHSVGKRAVIVGAELVSLSALLTLRRSGTAVIAMVTEHPRHQVYWPYLAIKWLLADLVSRTRTIVRARVSGIVGRQRVEAVDIVHVDSNQTQRVPCDTVVFTGDWIPQHELARAGGIVLDPGTRGPRVDPCLRTSARGVFAAGNLLRGAETADAAALEGRLAGGQIATFLEQRVWPETWLPIEVQPPIAWVAPNAISRDDGIGSQCTFLFRTRGFLRGSRVSIMQGKRVLYERAFAGLRPNVSVPLGGEWLSMVERDGPSVRVMVADSHR